MDKKKLIEESGCEVRKSSKTGKLQRKLPNNKSWKTICDDPNCCTPMVKKGYCHKHQNLAEDTYILKNYFSPCGLKYNVIKGNKGDKQAKNILRRLYYKDGLDKGNIRYITEFWVIKESKHNIGSRFKFGATETKAVELACLIIHEKSREQHEEDYRRHLGSRKKWTPETFVRFFSAIVIVFNTKQGNKKSNWIIPDYKWWQERYNYFTGALVHNNMPWQELRGKFGARTRNGKSYSIENLTQDLQEIYNNKGFDGLTQHELIKKVCDEHVFRRFNVNSIRWESVRKTNRGKGEHTAYFVGLPDRFACSLLGLEEEAWEYSKTINRNCCETIQELFEYHGRPIVEDWEKTERLSNVFPDHLIAGLRNNFTRLGGKDLTISFRKHFNLQESTARIPTKYEGVHAESIAEEGLFNFLFFCDFPEGQLMAHPKYKKVFIDCVEGWELDLLLLLHNGKRLFIELWGYDPLAGNKRTKAYNEKRKKKESFIKSHLGEQDIYIPIDYEDMPSNCQKQVEFFKEKFAPYFPTELLKDKEYDIHATTQTMYIKEFIELSKQNGGLLPGHHDLPCQLRHVISRYYGGIEVLLSKIPQWKDGKEMETIEEKMEARKTQHGTNISASRIDNHRNYTYDTVLQVLKLLPEDSIICGATFQYAFSKNLSGCNGKDGRIWLAEKTWGGDFRKMVEVSIKYLESKGEKIPNVYILDRAPQVNHSMKDEKLIVDCGHLEFLKCIKLWKEVRNTMRIPGKTILTKEEFPEHGGYKLGSKVNNVRARKRWPYIHDQLNVLGFLWNENDSASYT